MDQVGITQRVDLGGAIDSDARALAPSVVELVERDAALHEDLVRSAHQRLGSPGAPPLDTWRELARSRTIGRSLEDGRTFADEGRRLLDRNAHAIGVQLGTSVALPEAPFDVDSWTIVAAGRSDRVDLARRLPDGTVQRQVRRWPELVLANPQLAERHLIAPTTPKAMPTLLQEIAPPSDAPVAVRDAFEASREATRPAQRQFQQVSTVRLFGDQPVVLRTGTWDELARELKLTRLRPLPIAPDDAWNAASLVDAAGPKLTRIVMAGEAETILGGNLLVGANTLEPGHRVAADALELEHLSSWYDELGLKTWRDPTDSLVLTTGLPSSIGNASAHGNSQYATVQTGPRDIRIRDTLLNLIPPELVSRDVRNGLRDSDNVIRRNWRAVMGHEVGHVAVQQVWSVDANVRSSLAREANDVAAFARVAEHHVAGEAFSDLFGSAYVGTRDFGIRDLGRLRNGFGDLDQLRALIVAQGFNHSGHAGTQLITKPMLLLQERHGWGVVAEVTASATNQLGAMIGRGEIDAVDVTSASRALRDAAAMRFGAEDDVVRAMTAAWTKLRVLV